MEKVIGEQHLCVLSQDQNSAELWYVNFIRSMRGYDECIKLLKSHSVWAPSGGQDSSETLWLSLSDIYKTCSFSVVQAFDTCMISVLIKALKPFRSASKPTHDNPLSFRHRILHDYCGSLELFSNSSSSIHQPVQFIKNPPQLFYLPKYINMKIKIVKM